MRELAPEALKERLDRGERPFLLDVREPWEAAICSIAGSTLIPMGQVVARLPELDPGRETIVVCHHGVRSGRVAHFLEQQGFSNVQNLSGGIELWAATCDPEMARY